jgi:hypothetical protein
MIPDELDIEDIADIRRYSRPMLLAALTLAEPPTDSAAAAIEWNALGWEAGIHAMGSMYPSHEGITFTPRELDTVARLARYIAAREHVTAPEGSEDYHV